MKFLLLSDTHVGNQSLDDQTWDGFTLNTIEAVRYHQCSAVVHCGDWGSHSPEHLKRAIDEFAPRHSVPVLGVLGNHDFWNKKASTAEHAATTAEEIIDHSAAIYLPSHPVCCGGMWFYGIDGWYSNLNPPSNDAQWISRYEAMDCHYYMRRRVNEQIDEVLKYEIKRPACLVSHFGPPVPGDPQSWPDMCESDRTFEILSERFDIVCVGHSHRYAKYQIGSCTIINPGGDYGKPEYRIVETV